MFQKHHNTQLSISRLKSKTCCLCVQVVSFRVCTTTSTKHFLQPIYQGSGMQRCLKMMMTAAKLPTVFRTRLLSFWICQLDAMKLRIRMSYSCTWAVQLHQVIRHQKTEDKHKNMGEGDMMPPRWLHTLDINRIIVLMSLLPQTSFAQVHLTTPIIAPQGSLHVSAPEAMWIMLSTSLHRLILGIVLLLNQPRSVHCPRKRSSIDFVMDYCVNMQFWQIFSAAYGETLLLHFYCHNCFSHHCCGLVFTARRNRIASAVLATSIPSVCLSVTRRYCVTTTARSTVQFALSDSKMCLVL